MTTTDAPLYPEHEKLEAVSDRSQIIGEFLEFVAGEYGWHLTTWGPTWIEKEVWPRAGFRFAGENGPEPGTHGPPELQRRILRHEYQQIGGTINEQLARFFAIDLAVLETEKQAMLDAMRRLNDAED